MSDRRSYRELIEIDSFEDRFKYLSLGQGVADETFGGHRYVNQKFYRSQEWRKVRRDVILRDMGLDMAHSDYPILGKLLIHHINPITHEDLVSRNQSIFDMDNLVVVSHLTHNAIHYGSLDLLPSPVVERAPGDTKLW